MPFTFFKSWPNHTGRRIFTDAMFSKVWRPRGPPQKGPSKERKPLWCVHVYKLSKSRWGDCSHRAVAQNGPMPIDVSEECRAKYGEFARSTIARTVAITCARLEKHPLGSVDLSKATSPFNAYGRFCKSSKFSNQFSSYLQEILGSCLIFRDKYFATSNMVDQD